MLTQTKLVRVVVYFPAKNLCELRERFHDFNEFWVVLVFRFPLANRLRSSANHRVAYFRTHRTHKRSGWLDTIRNHFLAHIHPLSRHLVFRQTNQRRVFLVYRSYADDVRPRVAEFFHPFFQRGEHRLRPIDRPSASTSDLSSSFRFQS